MLNQDETLLTEKQVSDLLGLKQRTLQQWRLFDRGPKYIKLSVRVIRYRWRDVQEWLAKAQRNRPPE